MSIFSFLFLPHFSCFSSSPSFIQQSKYVDWAAPDVTYSNHPKTNICCDERTTTRKKKRLDFSLSEMRSSSDCYKKRWVDLLLLCCSFGFSRFAGVLIERRATRTHKIAPFVPFGRRVAIFVCLPQTLITIFFPFILSWFHHFVCLIDICFKVLNEDTYQSNTIRVKWQTSIATYLQTWFHIILCQ